MFQSFQSLKFFSKIYKSSEEAVMGIKNQSFLMVGGFGICGIPMNLINALKKSKIKDLIIASNNCGVGNKDGSGDWGLGVLLRSKQIKRMISSYVGQNAEFQRQYLNGQLELQICPQGTLAEKIRAGGYGIPAFYTATGVDTMLQTGGFPIKLQPGSQKSLIAAKSKPTAFFNGKKYLLQQSLFADYAFIKAQKADEQGNLVFNKTSRNFNADMATAAKCVIAEVDQIVKVGEIDPECVHVPGVHIDRIYQCNPISAFSQKKIQKKTTKSANQNTKIGPAEKLRIKIITRAAQEVGNGMNVNLGIGIPTLLPSVLPSNVRINLQSENGIFGVGPYPDQQDIDPDLINAGKETITILKGGSLFSSSQSFGIIRGGHLDLTILGALQVSESCDIANWIIPGKLVKGMGGAMDLVGCGSKVIVVMEHMAKKSFKFLQECTLPLTGKGVVNMVITQMAVFLNINGKLIMTEIADGFNLDQVQANTGFKITVGDNLKIF